jgi:hypothetical protein
MRPTARPVLVKEVRASVESTADRKRRADAIVDNVEAEEILPISMIHRTSCHAVTPSAACDIRRFVTGCLIKPFMSQRSKFNSLMSQRDVEDVWLSRVRPHGSATRPYNSFTSPNYCYG